MRVERIPWMGDAPPAADDLIRRLAADGFEAFAWEDGPGAIYAPHHHDHDESLWLVAGEMTFGIGGVEYRLGPGDRLLLPAGTMHTARTGRDGARYLIGQRRG